MTHGTPPDEPRPDRAEAGQTGDSQNRRVTTSRRRFIKGAIAGGVAAGASVASAQQNAAPPQPAPLKSNPKNLPPNVPDWSKVLGDGVAAHPYGKPSKFEKHVIRRDVEWLTASRESSVNFTPLHELDGIITPNGLCFERHHGGAAEINPLDYRLMIHGLVDKPLVFTLGDLKRMPRTNKIYFLECAANSGMEWRGAQLNSCQFTHGMIHNVMYTGVPLKVLLDEAGVKANAKWLLMEGADSAAMTRSLPLAKALDDCLIAFKMNGEALRTEQGYPVRLVVPGWEGNLWVKWLRRIEVGDQPWHTHEETSKYTTLMADGRARRFTFVMDAKSIVTNPSPEAALFVKGRNVLSGLAWSGRGKVTRVDVTMDGGSSWQEARIDGPVLDRSLTRFYVDFDWQGRELLIQSRAHDDTGYVQPTKDELRQVRGPNNIYHNNGIQTWLVRANGETENVEIS
jgi:sulfane dehydrogenase subunit SoxC